MTKRTHRLLPALAVVAAVAASFALWRSGETSPGADGNGEPLYYQDAMHPWVKSDRPGRCAICACEFVPIYERKDDLAAAVGLVSLSANSITVLNVQAEAAQRRPLVRTLRVAGTLEADATRKTIVDAPAPGRIDNVTVESAGVDVARGQPLATFYSPDLTFQTRRYIFRDRWPDRSDEFGTNPFPEGSTSERAYAHPTPLRGRPEQDPFYNDLLAPIAGTVIERNVFDGEYVAEADKLFTIVDCSVLWFRFDAYERQLPWLHVGQALELTTPAAPGHVFPATIAVIEPDFDDATRTVKVRANVDNPVVGPAGRARRLLHLSMYAEARVPSETPDVLTVPRTAVLFPGDAAYVYVDHDGGNYRMRRVRLGREGDTHWEILGGLAEGERVIVSGNVLIDAQAQFARGAATESMPLPPADAAAPEAQPAPAPVALEAPPVESRED